jgi:hypothetical protein
MSTRAADTSYSRQPDNTAVSEIFHAISQPLTALECGLEMSLRQDETVAQLRTRIESALGSAQLLHQRLIEIRALQDAADPGDTSEPVPLEQVLSQLQEDFLPVAETAEVRLEVDCEGALVWGNQARLKNGFFHLIEFLLHTSLAHQTIRILAQRSNPITLELAFGDDGLTSHGTIEPPPALNASDIGLRIAQRSFQAAGGNLSITQNRSGQVSGHAHLLLAN